MLKLTVSVCEHCIRKILHMTHNVVEVSWDDNRCIRWYGRIHCTPENHYPHYNFYGTSMKNYHLEFGVMDSSSLRYILILPEAWWNRKSYLSNHPTFFWSLRNWFRLSNSDRRRLFLFLNDTKGTPDVLMLRKVIFYKVWIMHWNALWNISIEFCCNLSCCPSIATSYVCYSPFKSSPIPFEKNNLCLLTFFRNCYSLNTR